VTKLPRRLLNEACIDDNPNALPIVSAKDSVAGMTTVATAVVIDGDAAYFNEAATHGRSPIEQGIEWVNSPDELADPRRVYVVWLFIKPDRATRQYVYHGAVAVDMLIDEQAKKGYKRLGHHAKQLGRALQGEIDLQILDAAAKERLKEVLNEHPDALANSRAELKLALGLAS
jgi:hypothetical protein